MVGIIYHVGLTVSDLDRSIVFYRDILDLEFQGEIFMEGEETDKMFRRANCKARVAYLNGSKAIESLPVELIQFVDSKIHKEQSDLFTTSISEVCFYTDDIDSVYKHLVDNNVECLSEPQYFDFRADGFGESRAFYFRDPDTGCKEFEIEKGRFSFRLTAPYRKERRSAASEAAKNE